MAKSVRRQRWQVHEDAEEEQEDKKEKEVRNHQIINTFFLEIFQKFLDRFNDRCIIVIFVARSFQLDHAAHLAIKVFLDNRFNLVVDEVLVEAITRRVSRGHS